MESDERSGRPQITQNAAVVARVKNLVMGGWCLTVRENGKEDGINKDSAHAIFHPCNKSCIPSGFLLPQRSSMLNHSLILLCSYHCLQMLTESYEFLFSENHQAFDKT